MSILKNTYTNRRCEERDISDVKKLIKRVFGVEKTHDYIQWKYFQPPAGKALSAVVFFTGELVAFLGAIPIKFSVDGKEMVGAQEVDVGIIEDHRNLAVYLKMVSQEKKGLLEDKVDFTYGITIKDTSELNHTLFGKKKIGSIPRLIKVIDVRPFLTQSWLPDKFMKRIARIVNAVLRMIFPEKTIMPPGMCLVRIDRFDDRFDFFWQRIKADYPIVAVGDSIYLNWRYVINPHEEFEIFCMEQIESGDIAGYIVLGINKEAMIKGSIYEFITLKNGNLKAATCLLRHAIQRFRQHGAAHIECWMFSHCHLYPVLRKSGFVYRKKKGFDLSFQQINRQNGVLSADLVEDVKNWHISKGISDIN